MADTVREAASFRWPVRVYYEDTDSGGIVYHANYLKYMERARTEWLRSLGFEQDELAARDGVLFAVRSMTVEYLRPARFNDLLTVSATITKSGRASLHFRQDIWREREPETMLCSATVRIASLDARTLRPCAMPERLLAEMP